MNRTLDVVSSTLASGLAAAAGLRMLHHARQPERPLELYEFESCPFCRKVREALTALDLNARIFPCPPRGERYRPVAEQIGGKRQFPLLVDPNQSKHMYESDEIVRYLASTYGDGRIPLTLKLGPASTLRAGLASLARPRLRARPSRAPEQPLELYSFEGSPYCRIVREVLCSLELPYLLHNVGKGSPKRDAFLARSGRLMVPYLIDPNTDTAMFESRDIARYLEQTYAA